MDELDSALLAGLQTEGRRSDRELAAQLGAAPPPHWSGYERLLVHVVVASTEALSDFVLDSLTKRREVAGVRAEVVFEHICNHVVPPG